MARISARPPPSTTRRSWTKSATGWEASGIPAPDGPTLLIVAQSGRLTYEAVLFLASLRRFAPEYSGRVVVAEPRGGPRWSASPGVSDEDARDLMVRLGAEILPFDCHHFGERYPNGNKVEALRVLDPDERFVFFDTDTLILGPLDRVPFPHGRPTASMAREGTWPTPPLYGPGIGDIWAALYRRFDVPLAPTLDHTHPETHWEHYLYFNAGWFTADDPHTFADRMIEVMTALEFDAPPELASQQFYPWLDQIALPVAIATFGGGRPGPDLAGLDGDVTRHWRAMPLFFATATDADIARLRDIAAPNRIKKVLKAHEPFKRMIYQRRGEKVRALFDRNALPTREQTIRQRIKRANLWMR